MERVKPTPNLPKIKWHTLLVEMDKGNYSDLMNDPVLNKKLMHPIVCYIYFIFNFKLVSLLDTDLTGLNNPIIEPPHAQTCQLHAAGTSLTLQDLTLKF